MKKISLILYILLLVNISYANNLNEAKRFLKLAFTQIDAEKFDEARESYQKAKSLIGNPTTWEAKYWDAVSDEFLGKFHLKMGNVAMAKISYEIALNKYKNLVKNKDGSPDTIQEILSRIDDLAATIDRADLIAKVINLDNTKSTDNLILPNDIEKFSCDGCKLKEFPYWLTNYKKLNTLILSNNNIKTFVVPKIPNLKYLDMSGNKFKKIEGDFADLPKLEYLYLKDLKLKTIPVGLIKLKRLSVLDLRGNNIPFSEIKNLFQNLPNTLILHDRYILETQKGDDFEATDQ